MASESAAVWDESFKATADLSSYQFYAVELTAKDTVGLCNNAGDRVIGILQNKPKQYEAAVVRMLGKSKWVSDGSGTAIAAGDTVGTDSGGKAVKKTADAALVGGISNDASSADGIVIEVFLTFGAQRAA